VAYESKALDDTQSRYAVIEKELLGICFGCKKFHDYIFGKKVLVETDHKPLIGIMAKPIHLLPARIQRMRMRLQRYDLEVKYRPGKKMYMYIADMLSRAHTTETGPADLFDDEVEVCAITVTKDRLEVLRKATEEDQTLQELKNAVLHDWPAKKMRKVSHRT
jgi:hypothetical protein